MNDAFDAVAGLLATRPALRVVNFHNTPASRRDELDGLLARMAARFSPLGEDALQAYASSGRWPGKPGIIPAFYNGYRNNFDVALPLLLKHGLTGWFFAVSGFVNEPPAGQRAFAARHGITVMEDEYPDGRHALSREELRVLDWNQVVACHTRRHRRADETAHLEEDTVGAQHDFRVLLGHPVKGFAWAAGAPLGESGEADRWLERAGYRFLFSNLRVQVIGR